MRTRLALSFCAIALGSSAAAERLQPELPSPNSAYFSGSEPTNHDIPPAEYPRFEPPRGIVVLPFQTSAADLYWGEGIAAEVYRLLVYHTDRVRVVGLDSSFNLPTDIADAEAARMLSVKHLVSGTLEVKPGGVEVALSVYRSASDAIVLDRRYAVSRRAMPALWHSITKDVIEAAELPAAPVPEGRRGDFEGWRALFQGEYLARHDDVAGALTHYSEGMTVTANERLLAKLHAASAWAHQLSVWHGAKARATVLPQIRHHLGLALENDASLLDARALSFAVRFFEDREGREAGLGLIRLANEYPSHVRSVALTGLLTQAARRWDSPYRFVAALTFLEPRAPVSVARLGWSGDPGEHANFHGRYLPIFVRSYHSLFGSIPRALAAEAMALLRQSPVSRIGQARPELATEMARVEPQMVRIAGGTFVMGDDSGPPEQRPATRVTVGTFWLAKHEVTFAQYDAYAMATGVGRPRDDGRGRERQPVVNVRLADAIEYILWLRELTGKPYRLPNEAEWEYAARGGTATRFPWGNEPEARQCRGCEVLDWTADYQPEFVPADVGSYPSNPFALHDMHGNVGEIVMDCWNDTHVTASPTGTTRRAGNCERQVIRGGSYLDVTHNGPDEVPKVTSAARYGWSLDYGTHYIGFRLAMDDAP